MCDLRCFSKSLSIGLVALALGGCGGIQRNNGMAGGDPPTGTPPTVAAVGVQVDGAAPNRKQEVQFSEAMDSTTINAQSFVVKDSANKPAPGLVSYDPDFNIATFQPSPALQSGASYTATITAGAASTGGMHLASPYTFTFTTRSSTDASPISISSVSPASGASCVSATTPITSTFDEAPDPSTVTPANLTVSGPNGAIAVKMSINVTTTQVVLTPTAALPSGTVNVTVSNVADLAGVKMTAPYTWSFSTACSGSGNRGGAMTQYQAPLLGIAAGGQVSVDTAGNVTVQLKGATPSQSFTVQFCPLVPLSQSSPNCFSIGAVSSDANGNGSLTVMFPKTGPWAGDFQLDTGSVNPEGTNFAYSTEYGPGYFSTLQPTKTVDGGILNAAINNAPQAPLTSGTVTYSTSPAPNGSFQFTLTGAPANAYIEVAEGGLVPYDYYTIGAGAANSVGDVTLTGTPSGNGGDIFDVSPQNGQAGWEGGFFVPQSQ